MLLLREKNQLQNVKWTWASFFATLNIVLIVVGYPSIASLFTPLHLDFSQTLSIPYRIFALSVSLISIILGGVGKGKLPKISFGLCLFYVIYALLIVKIIHSQLTFLGITKENPIRVFGLVSYCFFASLSVIFSYRFIKFEYVSFFILLFSFYILSLIPLGFLELSEELFLDKSNIRMGNSEMLNSISLAYVGCIAIVISIYNILNYRYHIIYKLFSVSLIPIALYTLLKTGSRSPVLVCGLVVFLYISSYVKNYIFTLISSVIMFVLCFFARFSIVNILKKIFPFTAERFEQMFLEKQYSGRDELVNIGLQEAKDNPLLGGSVEAPLSSPLNGYHSAVVDALAYLGYIGGTITILFYLYMVFISFRLLINKKSNVFSWVPLVALIYLFYGMLAGRLFCTVEITASFIVLVLIMDNELKKHRYN